MIKVELRILENQENAHLLLGLVEGGERPAEAGHVEVARVETHVTGREPHKQLVGVGAALGVGHVATRRLKQEVIITKYNYKTITKYIWLWYCDPP